MDKVLKKYKMQKYIQGEIENLNRQIGIKEIQVVSKDFPKVSGLYCFTAEFYQTFKD